jgi:CheY-like chemotaxis protein
MPSGNETILLVEDDAEVRDLVLQVLQNQGHYLLAATNGEEALQLASQHAGLIHLLLTDVIMPGMSGKVLADRLVQSWPDLKVLYMSGYNDDIIAHHGILDEGVFLLQKPFGHTILARKVREVLDS